MTGIFQNTVRRKQLQNSSALVCLVCRRGVTPKVAASLFHPVRSGDICTTTANGLILFFSSCYLEEINSTMDRVFVEPVDKIFRREFVESEPVKIMKILREISSEGSLRGLELEYVRVAERKLSKLQQLRNGTGSIAAMGNSEPPSIRKVNFYGDNFR